MNSIKIWVWGLNFPKNSKEGVKRMDTTKIDAVIRISNRVYTKIKSRISEGSFPDVFKVLIILLGLKSIQDTVITSIGILIELQGRSYKYDKQTLWALDVLKDAGLITFELDGSGYKRNKTLMIKVSSEVYEPPYTMFRLVNMDLFDSEETKKESIENKNNALLLFCYLKSRLLPNHSYVKGVTHEKICEDLCFKDKKSLEAGENILLKLGMLHILNKGYDASTKKMKCHKYKCYDYDNPINNANYIESKKKWSRLKSRKKVIRQPETIADVTGCSDAKIVEVLAEEDIEHNIDVIMSNPRGLSPIMLTGRYAQEFNELDSTIYPIRKVTHDITCPEDISEICENFSGKDLPEYLIHLDIDKISREGQNDLLNLVEEIKTSIVFTKAFDTNIPALNSRIMTNLHIPLRSMSVGNKATIHQCIDTINKRNMLKKMTYSEEMELISRNCPALYKENFMSDRRVPINRSLRALESLIMGRLAKKGKNINE
jgi:hypothetical protein